MSQLSVPFHARFSFLPVHSVPITYSGSPAHSRNYPPSSRDPSTLCAPPGHGIGSAVDAGNSVSLHSTPTGHDSVTRTSPVSQRPASRPHGPSLSAVLAGEGAAQVEPVLLPDRVVFRGQLVTEAQRPLQRLPVTGGRPLRAGVHHEGQQLRRATDGLQQTVTELRQPGVTGGAGGRPEQHAAQVVPCSLVLLHLSQRADTEGRLVGHHLWREAGRVVADEVALVPG